MHVQGNAADVLRNAVVGPHTQLRGTHPSPVGETALTGIASHTPFTTRYTDADGRFPATLGASTLGNASTAERAKVHSHNESHTRFSGRHLAPWRRSHRGPAVGFPSVSTQSCRVQRTKEVSAPHLLHTPTFFVPRRRHFCRPRSRWHFDPALCLLREAGPHTPLPAPERHIGQGAAATAHGGQRWQVQRVQAPRS